MVFVNKYWYVNLVLNLKVCKRFLNVQSGYKKYPLAALIRANKRFVDLSTLILQLRLNFRNASPLFCYGTILHVHHESKCDPLLFFHLIFHSASATKTVLSG